MRYAGQEKCYLFRPTRASNGRRARWLETYVGSFALRRSLPSLPASIPQTYRKPGGREAFFSRRRTRSSAFPATSTHETQRLGCPCTKVSCHPSYIKKNLFFQLCPTNRTAGAVILRISHGYEVREHNDPFVRLADQATEQFSLATAPGGFLVDLIPACMALTFFTQPKISHTPITVRHIPLWFPGASFRRLANEWRMTLVQMVNQPYDFVKQQVVPFMLPF